MAVVTNRHGDTVYERQTGLLNKNMIYPLKVVLSDPKRANWPSRKCTLDATGLGGSHLPSLNKADITVRTDKHKQNIYGPSMTTVESVTKCHIFGKTARTALGISKAAHEFLVFHYFATDSITYWNSFMHEVMPLFSLPVPAVRRAEVVELLQRIHIAPSHRRMPHHTWKDALSLVMDLLLGFGKRRYFSMARVWQRASRVSIKGFSWAWPSYMSFGKSRVSQHILWRSLHATPVFYMKNDPVLGVVKADIFWKMYLVIDHRDTKRISSLALTVLKL